MKELSKNLIDQARELNTSLENSYLALAVVLYEINETESWKDEYESFADFYTRDLGRERSTVSRLLTCGRWIKENDVMLAGVQQFGYRRLSQAIKANPDETPEKVLAIAEVWTSDDFKAQKKEDCKFDGDPILVCPKCWGKYVNGKHP